MSDGPDIACVAAAIGEHARAEVLAALLADRALTASELASLAGVTKATMSAHLSKLLEVGLIAVEQQGRHRYFRLAGADVGKLLESLMVVAYRAGAVRLVSSPKDPALRKARVCYDHLAGAVGVQVYESLIKRRLLKRSGDDLAVTVAGHDWFSGFGIDLSVVGNRRRILCRPCLDWSERRTHLAGALGNAFLERVETLGWARRAARSRIVCFTPEGERKLTARLKA